MVDDDQNALLTSSQRAYLDGDADFAPDSSRGRTTRTRLRQRLRRGLKDFSYLADPEGLEDRDIEHLLQDDPNDLREEFEELVAFLYRAQPEAIESIVAAGVNLGVRRVKPEHSVDDVTISIEKRGAVLRKAREQLDRDETLTDREVRILLEEGDLPAEEIREHVQNHPTPRVRFR